MHVHLLWDLFFMMVIEMMFIPLKVINLMRLYWSMRTSLRTLNSNILQWTLLYVTFQIKEAQSFSEEKPPKLQKYYKGSNLIRFKDVTPWTSLYLTVCTSVFLISWHLFSWYLPIPNCWLIFLLLVSRYRYLHVSFFCCYRRNESIIGTRAFLNKQPGAVTVSGDDPRKFAAAMVEYSKDNVRPHSDAHGKMFIE